MYQLQVDNGGGMTDRVSGDSDKATGFSRREFVAVGAACVAGTASTACTTPNGAHAGASGGAPNTASSLEDNIYTRLLGVRPHLGAHEHITTLGGCRMPPEVIEAMREGSGSAVSRYTRSERLQKRGRRPWPWMW